MERESGPAGRGSDRTLGGGTGPDRVAVLGAGLMGAAIGQVLAAGGSHVTLFDPDPAACHSAPGRIRDAAELLEDDAEAILARVRVVSDLPSALDAAEVVIEAGPERLEVKRELFAQLDALTAPEVILASNTSSIPIMEIAEPVRDRRRVVGAHFWNPPYLVPLVEVVQTPETSAETVHRMMALLAGAGMKPVHLRADIPGFVGNRLQHALKREAIALVAAGVCDAEAVDTVVKHGFGLRLPFIGPLEQSDMIGLQLTLDIHRTLMPSLDRTDEAHPLLVQKVAAGELGMRTGRGFREWTEESAESVRSEMSRELLALVRRRRRLAGAQSAGQDNQEERK